MAANPEEPFIFVKVAIRINGTEVTVTKPQDHFSGLKTVGSLTKSETQHLCYSILKCIKWLNGGFLCKIQEVCSFRLQTLFQRVAFYHWLTAQTRVTWFYDAWECPSHTLLLNLMNSVVGGDPAGLALIYPTFTLETMTKFVMTTFKWIHTVTGPSLLGFSQPVLTSLLPSIPSTLSFTPILPVPPPWLGSSGWELGWVVVHQHFDSRSYLSG